MYVFGGQGGIKERKKTFYRNYILIRSPRPWYFIKGMYLILWNVLSRFVSLVREVSLPSKIATPGLVLDHLEFDFY
jgi:hypothetical protein